MFLSSRASATSSAEKYWQISTEENTWSSWIGTCCNKNPSVRICRLRSNFSKGMIETKKMTLLAIVVSNKHLWQSQEVLATHVHKGPFKYYINFLTGWVGSEIGHFFLLKVSKTRKQIVKPWIFQKINKWIRLYYYDTSGRLVFVRFLEEIEDTKKTFRN